MTIADIRKVISEKAKIIVYEKTYGLKVQQKLEEINKDCDSFKVTRIMALRPEYFYIEVEEA